MDMLEAITGEMQTGAQVDTWAIQREDGSWLIDGIVPVSELKARLDTRSCLRKRLGRYNIVAGLLQSVSGRLLKTADWVECAGWRFDVLATQVGSGN